MVAKENIDTIADLLLIFTDKAPLITMKTITIIIDDDITISIRFTCSRYNFPGGNFLDFM